MPCNAVVDLGKIAFEHADSARVFDVFTFNGEIVCVPWADKTHRMVQLTQIESGEFAGKWVNADVLPNGAAAKEATYIASIYCGPPASA